MTGYKIGRLGKVWSERSASSGFNSSCHARYSVTHGGARDA